MTNDKILQKVTGVKSKEKYNIFLACDNIFYHRFAINCAKSILHFAPYLHIHIHIVNHEGDLFQHDQITYTFEEFPNLPEHPSTRYYASVRLLRAEELFEDWQHVMIIDVDSLAMKPIPIELYIEQTSKLSQLVRKGGRWINGMICLGLGEEAKQFKKAIKESLLENYIPNWHGWYDQDSMNKIRNKFNISPIELSWLNFSLRRPGYFYSAKGERKESTAFEEATEKILRLVKK